MIKVYTEQAAQRFAAEKGELYGCSVFEGVPVRNAPGFYIGSRKALLAIGCVELFDAEGNKVHSVELCYANGDKV